MKIIERKISELKPAEYNPRQLTDKQFKDLKKSLNKFGFVDPVIVNMHPERKNVIIGGHQRLKVWESLGNDTAPTVELSLTLAEEQELNVRLNRNTGQWDYEILANLFEEDNLIDWGFDRFELGMTGGSDDDALNFGAGKDSKEAGSRDDKDTDNEIHAKLVDRFIVPPFSVLDTRQGYWVNRKQWWKEKIGDKGESREGALSTSKMFNTYSNGVSVLDPVMSELIVHWFGLPGGKAFDCFAGDTVFGFVAGSLGQQFTGIELRQEQAEINNTRVKEANLPARYICDDGQNVNSHLEKESQDLFFSCPPYFDLEKYSALPNDASNQKDYKAFLSILYNAFSRSAACLKENRFAVVVVGDIRDKNGFYYRFTDHVKDIFHAEGMQLYNELILVEPLGTLPQRVGKIMEHRKVGKCHQNVLVFYKGDPKKIKTIYPKIETNESESVA